MKNIKRYFIILLCLALVLNTFKKNTIESKAVATTATIGVAWLIEVLISIGVTYVGYDLVTKLAAPELDDLKEGLLLEPEVESWVNNNKDKKPDEKPNINLPHAVIASAAEVITRKKDSLVTISNMFRETGLAVFNRDSANIVQKTALTFKNFGDMDSYAIDSIKGYLKIDYATLAENYYAIPRQNGLLFIPKGCLYINNLYGVNNKSLANIAITKEAFNTYWDLAINKGAYDAQEFLKANVKDVYLVNTLRGQNYSVTKYNPFVFNNLTAPDGYSALTVYGNAENYINGDLVFPTGIGYNQLNQVIDAWWNRSLNISALKVIDTGVDITGDIEIDLDELTYNKVAHAETASDILQEFYAKGFLDPYVKEITGALDKQTATNQTFFTKIFDKLWEWFQKIWSAIKEIPVALKNLVFNLPQTFIDIVQSIADSVAEIGIKIKESIVEALEEIIVPDSVVIQDKITGIKDDIKSRTGILTFPLIFIVTISSLFLTAEPQDAILKFPPLVVPFSNIQIYEGGELNVTQLFRERGVIYNYYLLATDILLIGFVISLGYKKMNIFLGG